MSISMNIQMFKAGQMTGKQATTLFLFSRQQSLLPLHQI